MNKNLLELMVIIANRGLAERVLSATNKYATFPSIVISRGTADNDVVSALGIGEPEKDMIFCFCENKNVQKIYDILKNELLFKEKRYGIAFTVPVSAVAGNLTLQILLGKTKDLM